MAWKPPKLYEFFIKGINALSKEVEFTGWDECFDFTYFHEKNMCICCIKTEPNIADVYTLSFKEYTTINTSIKIPLHEEVSRVVRSLNDDLYLKTAEREVSIYFNANEKLRGKVMRINNIQGMNVADFLPIGVNRVVFLSVNGHLSLFEFNKFDFLFGQISNVFKLKLDRGERTNCISVCRKGMFIAVGSVREVQGECLLSRLVLLGINQENDFEVLKIKDYSRMELSMTDGSFFSDINLDFYHGGFPLIIAIQKNAQNLMFVYTFDGEDFHDYQEPYQLHTSNCIQLVRFERMLTTVDENGIISRISFVVESEPPSRLLKKKRNRQPSIAEPDGGGMMDGDLRKSIRSLKELRDSKVGLLESRKQGKAEVEERVKKTGRKRKERSEGSGGERGLKRASSGKKMDEKLKRSMKDLGVGKEVDEVEDDQMEVKKVVTEVKVDDDGEGAEEKEKKQKTPLQKKVSNLPEIEEEDF